MKTAKLLATWLGLALSLLSSPVVADVSGQDDRVEIRLAPENLRHLARSVALHTSINKLVADQRQPNGEEHYFLLRSTLQDEEQYCPDAPYTSQGVAGVCTAFLVAPQVLMTSAHCLREGNPAGPFDLRQTCQSSAWIFDYQEDENGRAPARIRESSVYRCAQVLRFHTVSGSSRPQRDDGQQIDDYAFVRLDRPVPDRAPLVLDSRRARVRTPVFAITHPHGLPLKAATRAHLAAAYGNYFRTDLDVSVGSSGGPVFDADSGRVIGLVKGVLYPDGYREATWHPQNRCRTEYVFPEGHAPVIVLAIDRGLALLKQHLARTGAMDAWLP